MLYKFYKYKIKDYPCALDPFVRLKGFGFGDPTTPLWEENIRLAGKGKPFLPVVFMGPYIDMGRPVVMVNSPELILEATDDLIFSEFPPNAENLADAFGLGLPSDKGERWKRHRTTINPLFFNNRLQMFAKHMTKGVEDVVAELRSKNGKEISCNEFISEATLKVLIDSLFTREDFEPIWAAKTLQLSVENYGSNALGKMLLGGPLNLVLNPKSRKLKATKTLLLNKIIALCEKARTQPFDDSNTNFVSMLVAAKDEKGNPALTDYEIAEEALMMMFAGHDTSKNAICWTLYFLCQDRKSMEKVQQEVDRELKGKLPTYEDIPNLQYCKNAISESLRLRPPLPFLHRCTTEDRYLGKHFLPKQTTVMLNLHAAHTDPTLWENPEVYNPDRFSTASGFSKQYFPFAYGPRSCVGHKFAMNEIIIFIAALVQNFDIHMGSTPVRPLLKITVQPVGLSCKFIPRRK